MNPRLVDMDVDPVETEGNEKKKDILAAPHKPKTVPPSPFKREDTPVPDPKTPTSQVTIQKGPPFKERQYKAAARRTLAQLKNPTTSRQRNSTHPSSHPSAATSSNGVGKSKRRVQGSRPSLRRAVANTVFEKELREMELLKERTAEDAEALLEEKKAETLGIEQAEEDYGIGDLQIVDGE